MLNIKKALKSVGTVIGLVSAMSANAYVVGGIDFGTSLNLSHLETTTLAQTYVNGNGQSATAYGYVSTLNGSPSYCASGSCGLYYVANFGGSQNFNGGYLEFTTATLSVYLSNSFVNLLNQNSPANVALIQTMTPWLTLTGHGNLGTNNQGVTAAANAVVNGVGQLTGTSLTATGFGLFDVSGPGLADVKSAFDTNKEGDAAGGFADVTMVSSFNNSVLANPDALGGFAAGCKAGTAASGAWCYQGSASLRGSMNAVPEPSSLALAGLGFGVMGLVSRRRRTATK